MRFSDVKRFSGSPLEFERAGESLTGNEAEAHVGFVRALKMDFHDRALHRRVPILNGCQPEGTGGEARDGEPSVLRDAALGILHVIALFPEKDAGRGSVWGHPRDDTTERQGVAGDKTNVDSGEISAGQGIDDRGMILGIDGGVPRGAVEGGASAVAADFRRAVDVGESRRDFDPILAGRAGEAKLATVVGVGAHVGAHWEAFISGAVGYALDGCALDGIAELVRHAAEDRGTRGHFDSEVRAALAGFENEAGAGPGLCVLAGNGYVTGALRVNKECGIGEVGDGEVAVGLADGSEGVAGEGLAAFRREGEQGDVRAGQGLAGDGVDDSAVEDGGLRRDEPGRAEEKKRDSHLELSIKKMRGNRQEEAAHAN